MRTAFSLDFVLRLRCSKSATPLHHYLRQQLFYRVSATVCEHLPVTSIGETDARDWMTKDERLSPPPLRWSGSYARRNHSSLRNRMLFTTLHEFIFTTIIAPSVTRPPSHYAQLSMLTVLFGRWTAVIDINWRVSYRPWSVMVIPYITSHRLVSWQADKPQLEKVMITLGTSVYRAYSHKAATLPRNFYCFLTDL